MTALLKFTMILCALSYYGAQGSRYEFVLENEEIFDNCPEQPNNNGVHDVVDITDMLFEYMEGAVKISGNMTTIWEGVQSDDRIQVLAELYKLQRGTWQPTVFSISVEDLCPKQFSESAIWYKIWTKHIPENERECLSNYGHTYHHNTFLADTVLDFVNNMDGRHKIVVKMDAFDEENAKRPVSICFQIFGEFMKLK